MVKLIDWISQGGPAALSEIITLGRTKKPAVDVLAYIERPAKQWTDGGIEGRPKHLRGPEFGLRNLTNYIARSL